MEINGFPIKRVNVSELQKAPYNPRKISEEQRKALQRSLKEFGTVEPIIVNKQTGNIVGGHQRLDALLALGEQETDVLIVDMPEEREQALNIALNRISGEWDNALLSDVLLSLHDDMREIAGFTQEEIAALLPKENMSLSDLAPDSLDQQQFSMSFVLTAEERDICARAFGIVIEKNGCKKPAQNIHSVEILVSLCNEYSRLFG